MQLFDQAALQRYIQKDPILDQMHKTAAGCDASFVSHRWLLDSPPKRMIFQAVYGDLLVGETEAGTVLDVGGGYTALTRLMLRHDMYTLLDIMVHDPHEQIRALEAETGQKFWVNSDWYHFTPTGGYDIVIANDLFPNVDQRLDAFLEKYLPLCREMRLTLTYYNTPRWYQVQRVDADEVFHMMAWDGQQTRRVLQEYADFIKAPALDLLLQNPPSLFANGRQICMVTFNGKGAT